MGIDMSAAKAPPKKRLSSVGSTGRQPTVIQTDTQRRAEGLTGLAQMAQGICILTGNYADAAAVGQHGESVCGELARLAETATVLAGPIDFLIQVGPYSALLAAVLPLGLQIAANHGWVDASRLYSQGVMPPAVLEAQMQAQVAQQQAQYIKAQQSAMQAAQQAQREVEELMNQQKAA